MSAPENRQFLHSGFRRSAFFTNSESFFIQMAKNCLNGLTERLVSALMIVEEAIIFWNGTGGKQMGGERHCGNGLCGSPRSLRH